MNDIKEYYESYWSHPEDYSDPTTPVRIKLLKKQLAYLPAGSRVLDAGCGRGEFCALFHQMGLVPTGSDLSERVIADAKAAKPELNWHAGEIEELVSDQAVSFDMVFSSEVIEHLFDVTAFLTTTNQLLSSNGRLILTTPYHGIVKNIFIDLFGYAKHYDPVGQHIRFFDTKGLRRCLEMTGFQIETITGYGRPWPMWKSFFVVAKKIRHMHHKPVFGTQGEVFDS